MNAIFDIVSSNNHNTSINQSINQSIMTDPISSPPSKESVVELTRDLFETEETVEKDGDGGGVDWGFGNDAGTKSDPDTASMTGDDEDDDDNTVDLEAPPTMKPKTVFDMDSSEDEAEFSDVEGGETKTESPEKQSDLKAKDSTPEQPVVDTPEEPAVDTPEEPTVEASEAPAVDAPEEPAVDAPEEQEGELASPTLRRSRRTPKKRRVVDEEEVEVEKKTSNKKKKKKKDQQPDEDQLLQSTDYLFGHADKDNVTVADMYRSLEAEFDCRLSKATRKLVKAHLIQLMTNQVEPSVPTTEGEQDSSETPQVEDSAKDEEEDDHVSEQGDVEESEASEYEEEEDDDELAVERPTNKKKSKKSKASKKQKASTTKEKKPKRPSQRKAAKAARLVEAMRLRKKRMEELRIRNEEMQLTQTKEEQERAEMIAAKLDTNTDELRMKRFEDRLDLLTKLDQKRIHVLDAVLEEEKEETPPPPSPAAAPESESEDENSSDDEDLVIVGATRRIKPLQPLQHHVKASAIDILDRIRSPDRKRQLQQKEKHPSSPSRFSRVALRNQLKQQQRAVGNKWLARELGYKTEQEHLKDCQAAATQKQKLTMLREHDRVKANERKQLRERFLLQDEPVEEADEQQQEEAPQEEDEEMQLAKEIAQEQANTDTGAPDNENHEQQQEAAPQEEDEEMHLAKEIEQEQANKDNGAPDKENKEPTDKDLPDDKGVAATSEEVIENVSLAVSEEKEEDEPQDLSNDFSPLEESSPPLETQPPNVSPALVVATKEVTMDGESSMDEPISEDASIAKEEESEGTPPLSNDPEASTLASSTTGENALEAEHDSDDEELEFQDEVVEKPKSNQPRNAAWQAMLQKEEEKLKKRKKGGRGLVEQEAEEEEEEEVAGLEDFGFSIKKKSNGDDDEEDPDSFKMDEDDLKHVVDDVSDDEGDEEAGRAARKTQEQQEEKERHKAMLRRMREGYDGRRGGIAGSGVGARGMHRFDQLVAADNREDARRLGLLNDDELDSDNEDGEKKMVDVDDEDDEAALLDKVLKDRFLHRTNVDLENFSDDEEENQAADESNGTLSWALILFFATLILIFIFVVAQKMVPRKLGTTRKKEHKNVWQRDSQSVPECADWKRCTLIAKSSPSKD